MAPPRNVDSVVTDVVFRPHVEAVSDDELKQYTILSIRINRIYKNESVGGGKYLRIRGGALQKLGK